MIWAVGVEVEEVKDILGSLSGQGMWHRFRGTTQCSRNISVRVKGADYSTLVCTQEWWWTPPFVEKGPAKLAFGGSLPSSHGGSRTHGETEAASGETRQHPFTCRWRASFWCILHAEAGTTPNLFLYNKYSKLATKEMVVTSLVCSQLINNHLARLCPSNQNKWQKIEVEFGEWKGHDWKWRKC